tara:strand:- start:337 stop:828 length:492 start_codon:yes stop_codon:yes gene_type:complete
LSLGLSAPWPAYAEKKFTAQVTHVYDGDTIKVKIYHPCTDTRPCQTTARIRLAEIDTPEHDQPYGHEAQKALEELVQWQDVNIVWTKKDSYNRFIAQVYLDQDLINHEMIREGHAWVYPYFTSDPQIYQLEHTARLAQKGVWQRPVEQLIPPWIWRRSHKRSK